MPNCWFNAETTEPGRDALGYYHERKATGTRDSLRAKAIVFRGPKEQAALVVCDLTGIAADLSFEVSGVVAEMMFQSGDEVAAGTPLMRLRSEDEVSKLAALQGIYEPVARRY